MPERATQHASTRILRVMTSLDIGGPAREAIYLTQELRERGFDTRLVSGCSSRSEGQIQPPPGAPSTSMPWLANEIDPRQDLRAYRDLSGIMRRWRPRVVHTHLAKAGALGRLAAQRANVPVVVHTFHGQVLQEYFSTLKNTAVAMAERALAARTDALVAVAPWVRDELLAMGIGSEERWHVVPMGVDLDPLLRSRVDPGTARTRLGLPLDVPIVGCVGRLVAIKDHTTFFQAAARVAQALPDAMFVLAGDGELRERLRSEARSLLGDRVRFLGWVDDLPTLYGAFDVVALTSRLEGTPEALVEASASGTPVVATNVDGVSDVVRDHHTGLLVPPRDPVALAANLLTLLQDPEGARRMGEEGARWVQGRFSDRRLADDLSALYTDLSARKDMINR
jgi:glycosyltransferase involved in cell wall biosynthesis